MGKGIPVVVGEQTFPTKMALRAYVRGLMGQYVAGSFLDEADLNFCLALFRSHPDAQAKFGSGISRVEVRRDQYGNKHFQVHRTDGSSDDISWVHCIKHAA